MHATCWCCQSTTAGGAGSAPAGADEARQKAASRLASDRRSAAQAAICPALWSGLIRRSPDSSRLFGFPLSSSNWCFGACRSAHISGHLCQFTL